MSKWSPQELRRTGAADEVDIAAVRADGTLSSFTTIWVVRVGDDLYVRSYRGLAGGWYRTAQRSHRARLRAAGAERDVVLEDANGIEAATIDEAYRAKYGRSPYVDTMVAAAAATTTMQVCPR
jgi:hypothetical protein